MGAREAADADAVLRGGGAAACADRGRPDGLGGIDFAATDADAARSAARERGLLREDGVILIGGMRLRLV